MLCYDWLCQSATGARGPRGRGAPDSVLVFHFCKGGLDLHRRRNANSVFFACVWFDAGFSVESNPDAVGESHHGHSSVTGPRD